MKEIRGDAKSIRQLLGGAKYAIDYYQREYKWGSKQLAELLEDLAAKFMESYESEHDRGEVEKYGHYFLGSIIISDKDGQKFIIDGQQRLTTLSLLLIYLHNALSDPEDQGPVAELIFSKKFGKKSFNLEVPERVPAMEAIYTGQPFDDSNQPESVRNIVARYGDIEDQFPEELGGEALPYFVDWLMENVHLVEITAYSDEDAYTIFETMNDRGLSLTPTDMLKGYLLTNVTDEAKKLSASNTWKKRTGELIDFGKDEDADAIKSWLRSQYANSIRERKKNARPQDFDLIGTELHRWVRDNKDDLAISSSADFARFIEQDFDFYARQYLKVRNAAQSFTQGLEEVYFNAQHNFTLQYPLLLAPLKVGDSEATLLTKLRIVEAYLDILIARRIWNWRDISYSTMQYAMFLVMREIRGMGVEELSTVLCNKLDEDQETFSSNDRFRLHGQNGRQIHRLLARLTDFVETRSGQPSRYTEYATRSGKHGYEIEHIWANHFERHEDEFDHEADFSEYRNRIGGLLLLPKSFNASYGDLEYGKKREHYLKQNLLAQSLHEKAYEHNPGFKRLVGETGLPFKAHAGFKKADLDEQQELYRRMAEELWNPDRLIPETSA